MVVLHNRFDLPFRVSLYGEFIVLRLLPFEGNLKLCDKVSFSMSIKCLADVGTNACAGTNKLICENTFMFFSLDLVADSDNFKRKIF